MKERALLAEWEKHVFTRSKWLFQKDVAPQLLPVAGFKGGMPHVPTGHVTCKIAQLARFSAMFIPVTFGF